ncbi:MAG: tRNA (N6-threonylcarbamoyladenosine(37)-N6)-methyltransferase TrmO [Candidatus Latescibacteria bacterium]|nr:tRNA (N6-threonylcarbamoyladenosine(37)-N6)-methyltransferase TrmO [Candidatus Latescibacterota bacterium]NIO27225.1 tRNA (N6-threonylcarbamoyladenosine(37)-N6)-methyltransferase TrmO [Candidatus Latescibacterota bacterium]NIO54749.1 tRNA (N6-threonylcarbamoyladenosine(37)-N6)-methyltransferase TrmO [Candidatus Latescibacterota bacterium]NIT00832.1 tRNA (N6-threonylcarbamoyladenosine(37)-N6)-methyltransferase TrmO [Candidatus Latescibacterota bacterium]NIT37755.1 tRNA (N6-threonylcarbamoylad
MKTICYEPIGVVHSPFKEIAGMPIQPAAARGIEGTVEVDVKYKAALQDLDGFSHIILIYHLHLSTGFDLTVIPFLDDTRRGLFATRAPRRPNPIGISVVRLIEIEEAALYISDVDIVDGTPLLDIKPYVPDFDAAQNIRIGWLESKLRRLSDMESNGRFVNG